MALNYSGVAVCIFADDTELAPPPPALAPEVQRHSVTPSRMDCIWRTGQVPRIAWCQSEHKADSSEPKITFCRLLPGPYLQCTAHITDTTTWRHGLCANVACETCLRYDIVHERAFGLLCVVVP
ncbi:hypothetical protein C8Q79DRAFT_253044 [Trametes meyenii]|nr:hypothetical protein C8Q79DRAFT_253044 [Trametes meyenii]